MKRWSKFPARNERFNDLNGFKKSGKIMKDIIAL